MKKTKKGGAARMPRRLICLILVLLLAALMVLPASGAAQLAFVAVNDTIPLTLSGGELPFYSGGLLYVPYSVFNSSSLGFYPSYTPDNGTLTLFSRNQRLVYDLSGGTVTDENKLVQYIPAISRNGTIFLPAAFSANHFGVQVSDLTSQSGYTVIRFTTGSQVYDDSLFIEKAENLISYRVEQYEDSIQQPSGGNTDPDTPSTPSTGTPGTTDPDDPTEEPDEEPSEVYLAVVDAGTMESLLAPLKQENIQAVFFLTADEILENSALVRRIVSEGHTIGLTCEKGQAVGEGLEAANTALDRVLGRKTLLALLPEGSDTTGIETAYSFYWRPSTRLTATQAAQAHGESCLLVGDGEQITNGLAILQEAECTFGLLTETTRITVS